MPDRPTDSELITAALLTLACPDNVREGDLENIWGIFNTFLYRIQTEDIPLDPA